jgi:hypothetical protein
MLIHTNSGSVHSAMFRVGMTDYADNIEDTGWIAVEKI